MEFAAFGDFDGTAEDVPYAIGKFLARIASIGKHIGDITQVGLVQTEGFQCARSVGDIGGGDMNCVRQALRIHCKMPLDARHQFAPIVPFFFCRIRVLDALRVNDDEAGVLEPTTALSHLANHIFLRLPPRG